MPDFNKGDFTQQGVNGHVNANVRLNEKRLVNIDLTSNEEAEGCTIAGTVKDLLNDKVYAIGSGVSGNIEITENGENINVAPYETATVNVSGGGDENVLYCTVTLIPDENKEITLSSNTLKIEDGILWYIEGSIDSETVLECPYLGVIEDNETFIDMPFYIQSGAVITATNAVNCQFADGFLSITDPTIPSSITLSGYNPK